LIEDYEIEEIEEGGDPGSRSGGDGGQ
jgi:hypothetical protein